MGKLKTNNTSKCYKGNYNGHLILKCWINVSLSIFGKYWLIRGLMVCGHLFSRVLLVVCEEVLTVQYVNWTYFKVYLVNREDVAGMLLLFRKRRRTHNEWASYCIWPRFISWNWPRGRGSLRAHLYPPPCSCPISICLLLLHHYRPHWTRRPPHLSPCSQLTIFLLVSTKGGREYKGHARFLSLSTYGWATLGNYFLCYSFLI